MPNFSSTSKERLATCHQDLQTLFNEVIKEFDCTILCGFRNQEDQDAAFNQGRSKLKWPHGKHNLSPSFAVDACPFPAPEVWSVETFKEFADKVKEVAKRLQIDITYGGDWADFPDEDHYQLNIKSC